MTSSLLAWMIKTCLLGSKFFSFRIDPIDRGGKKNNGRGASSQIVPFHFNPFLTNLDDYVPNIMDF